MSSSAIRSPYEQKFKTIDVVIIVSMWSLKFLDTWLRTLYEHTARVVYGDYVDSALFTRQSVSLMFAKCALAIAMAVVVDSYDHKYWVAIGGMALYVMTPVMALCMCITEKIIFLVSTLIASSTLFVTSPAAFGLVFNQKKFPIRSQVRRLVSIMEFAEGLLLVLLGLTIPEEAHPTERFALIAGWVLVLPFSIFVLTILERIRKYVTPDTLKERGLPALFKAIKNEISSKAPEQGVTKISVLFFVLLLLPAFSLTAMGAVVTNLQPKGDTQYQHPLLKQIIVFGQLTIIPLTEVVVSFAPISEPLAEMLVLGVAHVLNTVVLSLLVVRTHIKRQETQRSFTHQHFTPAESLPRVGRQGNLLVDPPGKGQFVWVLVTALDASFEFEDDPKGTLFDNPPFIVGYNISYFNRQMTSAQQNITITGRSNPPGFSPTFSRTIQFEENRMFVVTVVGGVQSRFFIVTGNDLEIPEVLEKSIVYVQNTFVGASYRSKIILENHELQVTTSSGSAIFNDVLLERTKTQWFFSQQGVVTFALRYIGNDPVAMEIFPKPEPKSFYVVPNALHIVVMPLSPIIFKFAIPIFLKKPPPTTLAPPVLEKPDEVLQTSFALLGITLGLTSVGYINFFWMGCPRRLRATIFAWFMVSNEILGWLAVEIIGHELGPREGIILLALGILTAAWHFILGWYYETKIMPIAWKRRASTPYEDI